MIENNFILYLDNDHVDKSKAVAFEITFNDTNESEAPVISKKPTHVFNRAKSTPMYLKTIVFYLLIE